jgi:nicotinate-nucleotide pyrophosphorylase (carboxylating)
MDQLAEVLAAGADVILLDNFELDEMRRANEVIDGRALSEASGRITSDTARSVAETGVDIISIGALTHTVKSLDLSLDM